MDPQGPIDPQSNSYTNGSIFAVDNKDTVPIGDAPIRINQQQILAGAVKGRFIKPIVAGSSILTLASSAAVANGRSVIFAAYVLNTAKNLIVTNPYFQIYIDNINEDSKMPESVSSANYPFYWWNTPYNFNGTDFFTAPDMTEFKIQVRNNDSASHFIYTQIMVRSILNNSQGSSSG